MKVWEVKGGIVKLNEGTNELNITLELVVAPAEATLYGTVKDKEGKSLYRVKITVQSKIAYTDYGGTYRIEGLTPGTYPVTFEKEGYVTVTR